MESIPKSSTRDRNLPTISFIGRPGDHRKGLCNLLDALALLRRVVEAPPFVVWIVGGSRAEEAFVQVLVAARPELADLQARGAFMIWGRVTTEALPELYSRSTVVVMPSTREQFGIVGIEAMMCGRPVIATDVGGLRDIVLSGHTGTLVVPDSPAALANAILGYLRNSDRVSREGANARRWALLGFRRDDNYAAFLDLYRGGPVPIRSPTRAFLRQRELEELEDQAATVLGEPVSVQDLSSSDHTSVRVDSPSGRVFCKWYRPERSDHITVLPVTPALRREPVLGDYVGALRFHRDNPWAPPVIQLPDARHPFAMFEWCEPFSAPEEAVGPVLRRVAEGFRRFRPLDRDSPEAVAYLAALRGVVSEPTIDRMAAHDLAAAAINTAVSGRPPRFQQVHPHVELLRMQLLMRQGAWVLAPEARQRLDGAISFLLDASPVPIGVPEMCHGSLKLEHLLLTAAGAVVACDTDSSRYVVGPFDEVHDVWYRVNAAQSFGAEQALRRLTELAPAPTQLTVTVSWLVVYVIFDALLAVSTGRELNGTPALRFCRDLPYAYRQLIR